MLEDLLNANKEFLANNPHIEHSHGNPSKHLAVVTCMSCHLVDFVDKALGLNKGDAIFIQNAGNTITPYDNSIIRSLAVGIYLLGVKEVAVVGHTNCNMKIDVSPLLDGLKRYGKSREIFKDADLREWFGFINNEEMNVRNVVDAIKNSPIIPQEITVYGLMIDDDGKIKEVYRYHEGYKVNVAPVTDTYAKTPASPLYPQQDRPVEFKPLQQQVQPKKVSPSEVKKVPPAPTPNVADGKKDLKKELFDKFKNKMIE